MDSKDANAEDPVKNATDNPDWLFLGLHGPSRQYHFTQVTRDTYRESSFLDHRMQPPPGKTVGADINSVNRALDADRRPANYVFHAAFCCSTLFCNSLQFVSNSLVLKEPRALGHLSDSLAGAINRPGFNRQRWLALLAPGLQLLEKSYPDQAGTVIKPSNAANNLISDILELRPARSLFMYGTLEEFLLSNLKGIDESRQMVPSFLNRILPLTDYVRRTNIPAVEQLEHLQQCAVLWHAQLYQFSGLAASHDQVRFLSAGDFLAEPKTVVRQALEFFDLPADTGHLDELHNSGPLSRHSKSGTDFDANRRANENAAIRKQHAGAMQKVLDWMDDALAAAPLNLKATLGGNE